LLNDNQNPLTGNFTLQKRGYGSRGRGRVRKGGKSGWPSGPTFYQATKKTKNRQGGTKQPGTKKGKRKKTEGRRERYRDAWWSKRVVPDVKTDGATRCRGEGLLASGTVQPLGNSRRGGVNYGWKHWRRSRNNLKREGNSGKFSGHLTLGLTT